MNRRDTFAAVAMHAILSRLHPDDFATSWSAATRAEWARTDRQRQLASLAYDFAAEMLNERQGRPDPDDDGEVATSLQEGLRDLGIDIENLGENLAADKRARDA